MTSPANSSKNIYCVGTGLYGTFMTFKDSVDKMQSDYNKKIGSMDGNVIYDPTNGTDPDDNPTATLYAKLKHILTELNYVEDQKDKLDEQDEVVEIE